MGGLLDAQLGEIELGADGYGEAVLRVGSQALRVTVEWTAGTAGEVDLLGEPLPELLARVLGWTVGSGHETVELFLEHHLAEFDPSELEALTGEVRPSGAEALRQCLQPIALHLGGSAGADRELAVDVGFGPDVTEVVLVVTVDPQGQPTSVDAES